MGQRGATAQPSRGLLLCPDRSGLDRREDIGQEMVDSFEKSGVKPHRTW